MFYFISPCKIVVLFRSQRTFLVDTRSEVRKSVKSLKILTDGKHSSEFNLRNKKRKMHNHNYNKEQK